MPQICPRCQARVGAKSIRCPECGTTLEGASAAPAPAAKPQPRVVEAAAPDPTPPLFLDQPAMNPGPGEPDAAPPPFFDEPATPGRRAVVPPPRPAQPAPPPFHRSTLAPAFLEPGSDATGTATATLDAEECESESEAAATMLAAQGLYESTADVQGWVERMLSGATDELPPVPQPDPEVHSTRSALASDRYLPPPDAPMIFYPILDEPADDWSDDAFPPRPTLRALAPAAAFPSAPEALAFLREELASDIATLAQPESGLLPTEPVPSAPAPEPEPVVPLARLEMLDEWGEWINWGEIPAEGRVIGRAEVAKELPGAETLGIEHLGLRYENSALVVDELGAIDGVYRRMTEPAELEDGQRFRIGGHVLEFRAAQPSAPAAPLASDERGVLCSRDLQALGYVDVVRTDGTLGLRFPLTKRDGTVIGREGPTACIALVGDPAVSTSHAQIRASGDVLLLEDLKSRSGTFLHLQCPTLLRPGDVLQAGKLLFRITGA